jgi:chromate reductase
MEKLKVLGICGSLRQGSTNRKLLQIAKKFAADFGAEVAEADLNNPLLPLYNQDIQDAGWPPEVKQLKDMVKASDVLLIASPEYNYSIPGVLKNAIDWVSRGENEFNGKTAAIFGASSGGFGTVRGQAHLRLSLTGVNVLILPQPQVMVGFGETAFNPDGALKDEKTAERLKKLVHMTMETAAARKTGEISKR